MLGVPTFKHNLLYVQCLLKENNCKVQFFPTYCTISDKSSKLVHAIGIARNGLYYVDSADPIKKVKMPVECNVVSKNSNNELALWHHRLEHASISSIKHIDFLKQCASKQSSLCVSCPMAKFTRLSFQNSSSHAKESFELLHMDICGPYKVPYKSKYRYFLTLVDDYSRNTWVYLLKLKSDALATLKLFLQYVSNHFKKSVKFLRSDNALEFTSSECQLFFSENGIIHQTSCPHHPQQNAKAERKHRHILEVARTLRFHAGLPLEFWGACVMTAVHIINKLPTAVLGNKYPHELLYNELPQ